MGVKFFILMFKIATSRTLAGFSRRVLAANPITYNVLFKSTQSRISNDSLKKEFDALSAEEQQEFIKKLKEDILREKQLKEQNQTQNGEESAEHNAEAQQPRSISSVIVQFIIPIIFAITGLHFVLGYTKRQQPTISAIIVTSNEDFIVYEYEIFGKTLRRLQKINGIKENLKVGDEIQVYYTRKNPRLSIYNPPYLYIPWIHTSSAKEVEYI